MEMFKFQLLPKSRTRGNVKRILSKYRGRRAKDGLDCAVESNGHCSSFLCLLLRLVPSLGTFVVVLLLASVVAVALLFTIFLA